MRPALEALFALEGDEFRDRVLANAMALSHELSDIPDEGLQRLRAVVRESWPADGVRVHVERDENHVRFSDVGAYAWLSLAPALELSPNDEQWADLATSGAVLTDTADWLRKYYTPESAAIAAAGLDSNSAGVWGQLLSAIPSEVEVPGAVIDAIVERVRVVDDVRFDLWQIGERLMRAGRLDALQVLATYGDEFERGLRPWRARLGEADAARALIAEMIEAIKAGSHREWDDPDWLEGVREPDLLPALFEALHAELESAREDPFGPSRAINRAILRIGGEEAVRRYDGLIEQSDDSRFKFLRIQRDEVVQSELRRAGQAQAAKVARKLDLPVLEIDQGDSG